MRYEEIKEPKDCRHRIYFHAITPESGWRCKHPDNLDFRCKVDSEFPPECPLGE